MILSFHISNGKRRTKSISTHFPVKGNKRKAEEMLQIARQEFIPPDDCEKQTENKKPDNTEDFTMPVLYKEATISGTKDEILFCDF